MGYTHYLEFGKKNIVIDIYGYRDERELEIIEAEKGFGVDRKKFSGDVDKIIDGLKKDLLGKGFNLSSEEYR